MHKLQESEDLYAPLAIHIIERYAYLCNDCSLDYFRNHVTYNEHHIQKIVENSFAALESIEILTNAMRLLSTFSLITHRHRDCRFGIKVEMHRLVQSTLGLIQEDEEREYGILSDLIDCKDLPNSTITENKCGLYCFTSVALIWSNPSKYEDLIS